MSDRLITAAEKRRKGLTALYLDGEYAVSVDTVTLASSGYTVGQIITDEALHDLLEILRFHAVSFLNVAVFLWRFYTFSR